MRRKEDIGELKWVGEREEGRKGELEKKQGRHVGFLLLLNFFFRSIYSLRCPCPWMDLILPRIAQVEERGRLQASSQSAFSLLSFPPPPDAQAIFLPLLSSENNSLHAVVENQDRILGDP